ncbi:MAG: hypothetical protein H0V82_10595 [Candidatus Protochlamydia sp.]|nr:hypothetical protein [Candidatus Protochlamydia sp.]
MPIHTLTDFEKFSLTRPYLNELSKINNSSYAISGPLASRIIGLATLSLTSLADAFVHSAACIGVSLTGVIVSPYNFLAFAFYPEYSKSEDYEFSSSLVHLMMSVECVFNAVILPFMCLLNPDRASRWMSSRTAKDNLLQASEKRIAELQHLYDQTQINFMSLQNEKNQCQSDLEDKGIKNQELNDQMLGRETFFADEQQRANQLLEEKESAILDLNRQLAEQSQHFLSELSREKNQLLVEKFEVSEQFLTFKNQVLVVESALKNDIEILKNENQYVREQADQKIEIASEEFKRKIKKNNESFEIQLFRETNHLKIEKSELNEQFLGYKLDSLKKYHLLERRLTILMNEKNDKDLEIQKLKEDLENENKFAQLAEEKLYEERDIYNNLHKKFDILVDELNVLRGEYEDLSLTSEENTKYFDNSSEKWKNTEEELNKKIVDLENTITQINIHSKAI